MHQNRNNKKDYNMKVVAKLLEKMKAKTTCSFWLDPQLLEK